ncbi:MAG TPA: cupredoxin domain-containing protein [Acidimicrobiales bacterium]|nr:cupredoxin domain-containing protein [Acidimicrobiales bacterium]
MGYLLGAALSVPLAVAGASPPHAKVFHVKITNFMFMPMHLQVNPNERVVVRNTDSVAHTLTATGGQFSTGKIGHDQTKSFRAPKRPGTYHFFCNIHQFMTGTLVVK